MLAPPSSSAAPSGGSKAKQPAARDEVAASRSAGERTATAFVLGRVTAAGRGASARGCRDDRIGAVEHRRKALLAAVALAVIIVGGDGEEEDRAGIEPAERDLREVRIPEVGDR